MIKSIKKRKANKSHNCHGCPKPIEQGKDYTEVVMLDIQTNHHKTLKYHEACYEKHKKAEENYIRNERKFDNMDTMRSNWDRAYQ